MPDFNDSIGYASYQQQYNSTSTTGYQSNDNGSIVLFFSIIFIIIISFVFYFWYTERHKVPIDQRGDQSVDQQQEIYLLVDNLSNQLKIVFKVPLISLAIVLWNRIFSSRYQKQQQQQQQEQQLQLQLHQHQQQQAIQVIPLPSHEHQRVDETKYYHLFSLIFIFTFIIALAILVGTLSSPIQATTSSSSTLLQSALFILVLCINLYLITRQRCYYMYRRKLHEDDEHISAIYDTRFSDWDPKILSNWIQILILVIEFFQLMTFPLRDLFTIFNTQRTEDQTELVSFILNAGGLMPDMRTPSWYTYSLWTCFVGTLFSLILALFIHCVNYKYPYKFPTRWVRWCIPVATLLYIPILTTFISSAACQSLNVPLNEFSTTLRCNSESISRQTYFWLSILGYVIAYFMMTLFLTSYERVPTKNEIAYKSISVAFIKNMGLLLALVFLLVESTTSSNRMRAILSMVILLTMICYNIKTRPCYVDKINFFRTASFSCILWTSALVAVLSDTNAAQTLGPSPIIYIIVGGWILIALLFIIIYFVYYSQPPDTDDGDETSIPEIKVNDEESYFGTLESTSTVHRQNSVTRHSIRQASNSSSGWLSGSFSRWIGGSSQPFIPTTTFYRNNHLYHGGYY
ncbi:hypothetical protein K501DRAFT_333407 [Backusella circina FSU 941]|nr:hypothetical protein K501DRAFT_333407 [Backusella circina FSU 941]